MRNIGKFIKNSLTNLKRTCIEHTITGNMHICIRDRLPQICLWNMGAYPSECQKQFVWLTKSDIYLYFVVSKNTSNCVTFCGKCGDVHHGTFLNGTWFDDHESGNCIIDSDYTKLSLTDICLYMLSFIFDINLC
jgi:hypothetical protein